MSLAKEDLLEMGPDSLRDLMTALGEPPYRVGQVLNWVFKRGATRVEEMTDLSKGLRHALAGQVTIGQLALHSQKEAQDGTRKFAFTLDDGRRIESVLIPMEDSWTLCLSTQVGCRMGCGFCLTGNRGFVRNLKASEIVGQILAVRRLLLPGIVLRQLVLMGMGEPLDNYENVLKALRRITSPEGLGYSPRRVTLSTAGLVPRLREFAREGLGVNLAVSLNATTDKLRHSLMPVAGAYPLKELMAVCRGYPLPQRRRITVEYVMIQGINDFPEEARRLAELLRGVRCKVNLIPLNEFDGLALRRPTPEVVARFQEVLIAAGYTAMVRQSKGVEVCGACGQLGNEVNG